MTKMEKQITLNLSDTEYKKLMELFHLGYLIEGSVTKKSHKQTIQEIDFMQMINKQAYECGSKNVFAKNGFYGITIEMEDSMLECFDEFKDFIYSGEDARQDKIIEQQFEEMMESEQKKLKQNKPEPNKSQNTFHTAKPFHDKMVEYCEEYFQYQLFEKSNKGAISNNDIIHLMINFLFENLVSDFNEITLAMISSKFRAHYRQRYDERIDKRSTNKIFKEFFTFIYGKYGIRNEKVMKGLSISSNIRK